MIDENDKKQMAGMIKTQVNKVTRFSQRKVGDTPTDDNQLVPLGYLNLNGSIAGRPGSVLASVGQQYFASDIGYPIFFTTNNNWVSATGSVVASN